MFRFSKKFQNAINPFLNITHVEIDGGGFTIDEFTIGGFGSLSINQPHTAWAF